MSRRPAVRLSPLVLFAALLASAEAGGQEPADRLSDLAARFAAMTAVTGYEQAVVDTILREVPGAIRDQLGNAVRAGAGEPRRLVACALDEPGWVVGGVRDDGWLTLRRSPGPAAPLRDQQLEGARVTVFGRRGAVPGVVAVRSIHLTRQRGELASGPFTADSALVDLGAPSAAAVARLGVGALSVAALARRPHRYGDGLLAAPWVGRRSACAALVHEAVSFRGSATMAFLVQQELGGRGLAAVARRTGPFVETLVLDARDGRRGALARGDDPELAARLPELGRVTRLSLPVRYAGSPVETIALADVRALAEELRAWLGSGR